MKTILVPVDFSDVTPAVIQTARQLAVAMQFRLLLLHVEEPDTMPGFIGFEPGTVVEGALVTRDVRADLKALQKAAGELTAEGLEVIIRTGRGAAVEVILDQAAKEQAAFIVLGSHGHGQLYQLLAGGVATGVLRAAPCPIVVVPSARG